jgi:deoxyinosine 3'endonuclease (endonuclease V)
MDALEDAADHIGCPDDDDAIGVARRTLRARLAQPEPEPVAWMMLENKLVPIHTAPPQREWQGLTYKERNDCLVEADPCEALLDHEAHELMRTVEAKLKEKNNG